MNVAVICLAYLGKPDFVGQLCTYFRGLADLYLHVDAKHDAAPYAALQGEHWNLAFVEPRHKIFWGGFNTVRAVLAAVEQARRAQDYDRFLLITEDTVPLLSPAALATALALPSEYMDVFPADEPVFTSRYGFFYFDQPTNSPRGTDLTAWEMTDEALADLDRLKALKRRGKMKVPHYVASTWWGLTSGALELIAGVHAADEWLRESFEFSAIPEEHYFPTILKLKAPELHYRHFIHVDFSRPPHPYVYGTFEELDALRGSGRLFARKVAPDSADVRHFVQSLLA